MRSAKVILCVVTDGTGTVVITTGGVVVVVVGGAVVVVVTSGVTADPVVLGA
jgi:hypothetical protein